MAPARLEILAEPAELGARRIALELLARLKAGRDRLDDPDDTAALHDFRVALRRLRSWLRAFRPQLQDTMRPRVERRLAQIAHVTGTSRDLEVHIAWVRRARRELPERARPGAEWLLRRLRGTKRDSDEALRDVIERRYAKAVRRTEAALERYVARVADDGPRFGEAAAGLLAREASVFQEAIEQVSAHGGQAHAARIAAKRLRYALEGLASVGVEVDPTLRKLKKLQATLGKLHDAQQFGAELETTISTLASKARQERRPAKRIGRRRAARTEWSVGLRAMRNKLRRTEAKALRKFRDSWKTGDWSAAFATEIAAVERSLHRAPAE